MTHKQLGVIVTSKGTRFGVWAPFAEAVAVSGGFNGWSRTPMERDEHGNWWAIIADVQPGQEYKYVLTYGGHEHYKNDPRALQMTTNAGNALIADPDFDWQDDSFTPAPRNQQVIYEMHIGTFNRPDASTYGTFQTAIDKLDYLQELGINAIELMPICSMSMDRGWGYAPDYIYAVESLYGGRHGLLTFVREAHRRGIAVILDVVYNHFGPGDGLDLWQFDGWNVDDMGGVYFYNDWRATTPWGSCRPDYGRPEVQSYITDNVRFWLSDCHIDGLRLDSTIYVRNVQGHNNDPDNDIPDGWKLMQQVTKTAHEVKPDSFVIAEDSSGNDYITKPVHDGGAGFSSQWQVTFPHAVRQALDNPDDASRDLATIAGELTQYYNGDAFQRVIYSDSHDSSANGSARLSEQIDPGDASSIFARRRSLLASALTLTAPGIPMLLQGQEFMQDGDFNDWRELDWHRARKFSGIVTAHRHLVALRRNVHGNTAGLTGNGTNILHLNHDTKILAYHRWNKGGAGDDTVIVFNFTNQLISDYTIDFPVAGSWKVRFNSDWQGYSPDFTDHQTEDIVANEETGGTGTLSIAPYSVVILSRD
ncbi:MAG TPA: alpha-amylase family glycosyl hydrolase [Candidatus Microsaccharimonas sp.]|nr:alpha-amylase family glycosyl hydrolase [Candidatus Microsaccharimonas sp.]